MSGSNDRDTIPYDLRDLANGPVATGDEESGEVRPLVPLKSVPWLVMTYEQLRELPLDSNAGFILSRIDGRCTVEMILDMALLPELDTLRILARLMALGAIELHEPQSGR